MFGTTAEIVPGSLLSASSPRVDFHALRSLLLSGNPQNTVFVPNSGNAGDSLIAEAIYQFFEDINLAYTTITVRDKISGNNRVVIGGGGNLVSPYWDVRNFIEGNFDSFGEVIVLPHSIQGHEDLLRRLDQRFLLICRERVSYDFCCKHAPGAKILIGDDMALLWNRRETAARAKAEAFRHRGDARFHVRNVKHLVRGIQGRAKIKDGVLQAFRLDVESAGQVIPRNNIDLSQAFATDSMARSYTTCAVNALANTIGRAEIVRTDRLHIAIISAMLGKTVEMYDNNYGKNRSVYEHSLASRFPNIRFIQ
jgi:exopolysaccharide biosynthesis predicted pyruvyltransferase EpsI